jgi:hypothetical protein
LEAVTPHLADQSPRCNPAVFEVHFFDAHRPVDEHGVAAPSEILDPEPPTIPFSTDPLQANILDLQLDAEADLEDI